MIYLNFSFVVILYNSLLFTRDILRIFISFSIYYFSRGVRNHLNQYYPLSDGLDVIIQCHDPRDHQTSLLSVKLFEECLTNTS